MSLNRAVNQHLDNCANKQPTGISPSSSYTFAIYNSASNNWSISPNNPIPLSKSPSPISSLTDGDSESTTTAGSGTAAVSSSWGSTKVSSNSSGIGTATTCQQRSSVITTCSSVSSSGTGATSASTSNDKDTDRDVAKSLSPTTPKTRKTIKFADDSAITIRCSDDTSHGIIISGSSSTSYSCFHKGARSSTTEMNTHQQNNTSNISTINTPTGTKPPSSPVKHGSGGGSSSGGISGNKSKSRHSSTSDSTCVTPTGSSVPGVGIAVGANSTNSTVGPDEIDKHTIRVTRKIFHNWRSACGRTKDKTKDFIRRWKTLPENQSECETGDSSEQQHHSSSPYASSGGGNSALQNQPSGVLGHSGSMDQSGGIGGGGASGTSTSINNTSGAAGVSGVGGADSSFSSVPPTRTSSGFGKIRSLTKKFSQDIPSEDISTSSISHSKPSAGWSVHVWGK